MHIQTPAQVAALYYTRTLGENLNHVIKTVYVEYLAIDFFHHIMHIKEKNLLVHT